jgi:cell division protein FtsW (lipid II flippase)/cell division protein FtsI/penicillin-binding protein 2
MDINRSWWRRRLLERVLMLTTGVILTLFFFRLYTRNQQQFAEVPARLKNGTMVNLNMPNAQQNFTALLKKGYYFGDDRDIAFAAATIGKGLSGQPQVDNIGELNKRAFAVNAGEAFIRGGESYKKRSQLSRYLIGFTYEDSLLYSRETKSPASYPNSVDVGMGKYGITGTIVNKEGQAIPNVLVRLGMLTSEDSVGDESSVEEPIQITEQKGPIRTTYIEDSAHERKMVSFVVYARTDAGGKFAYQRLPDGQSFELLPLQPGFEFGQSKGVQTLNENTEFTFVQAPHSLRLFASRDFNNLKRERSLIVRMPEEVNYWFNIIGLSFLVSFLLIHLLLTFRYPEADQIIIPVLMLLTGISILTLLSLQDPLRDRFLAQSTLYYFLAGIVGIIIFLFVDFKRFTTDSAIYRLFVFRGDSAANGWPWAVGATLLLVLTLFFGSGPEGSGVKVNLAGVQPSEVVKYLLIFFLAGFFATNEAFISAYTRWQKRWSFFGFALAAILVTILLFLMLGDLGPAMVACFTFIILFSFSRGDFMYMLGTIILFILGVWILDNVWLTTGIVLVLLLIASFTIRKGLSESSVMALVIMAGFLLLDKMPFLAKLVPGPMQRLTDRKAIWLDPWNNEVFGGDHIANAIWGMSSGGVSGQGIGEGFAKTIPEAHTDMILPAMGEELGLAGILCIFILFFVYLHRSILIGRQAGRPFLFYLTSGIGIATFVQFLLIAGGSIGALPLSGVSLPFMSYGGSSLIINMLAAGVLLSVSRVHGTATQMQYIAKQQDHNLVPALAASIVGIVLLGISISRYIMAAGKWVVTPSLVADRSGARIFSYNPRIAVLMKRLEAGTLYDRNGRILATSYPQLVQKQRADFTSLGFDAAKLDAMMHQRLDRYYPFGEQAFFWVGDMNTGSFMGGTNGYFGEYEHMADLRGFPAPETNFRVAASRYRPSRFLPPRATEMTVSKRDFSALSELLLAGINSKAVEEFKKRNRDVTMTIDVGLQTNLNNALASQSVAPKSRISVVVMDASNGDVILSSGYPLPAIDNPEQMQLSASEQNRLPYWITNTDLGFTHATQPGSTAKLITALAAFNKLGMAAAQKVIVVKPGDLIRRGGYEPDQAGPITLEMGIVRSNNPFFIRLANEMQLQEDMGTLYMQAGLFLRGVGGYYYSGDLKNAERQAKWKEFWRKTEFKSVQSYNTNNIYPGRARGVSGMAWGQGELVATPASMARVAAAIANNGVLVQNRYVMRIADAEQPSKEGIQLAKDPQYAALMTDYMRKQSAGKVAKLGMAVAGKTGTPQRVFRNKHITDGWYVFFTPKASGSGYMVTCVRIEDTKGSSVAVELAGKVVVPMLQSAGYIKGFDQVPAATMEVQEVSTDAPPPPPGEDLPPARPAEEEPVPQEADTSQ